MIVRIACLEGEVAPEARAEFDAHMNGTVVQQILRYPGIRSVAVRKQLLCDPGMTPVYMQFDLVFDSVEAMNAALASPVRAEVQAAIKAGMGPFKGSVTHAVYDITTEAAS